MGRAVGALWRAAPAGAALFTALAAHVALAPHLGLFGVAPDVSLVAVVALAARRGRRAGAAFGFAAGLGADLFLAAPWGTSALAYTLVGHVVGGVADRWPRATAAALCSPGSTCFACRSGRRTAARRSGRRRAATGRGVVLTAAGVVGGRLAVVLASTVLGGASFPGVAGLVHVGAVALVSAPLGAPAAGLLSAPRSAPAVAAVRRPAGGAAAGGRA